MDASAKPNLFWGIAFSNLLTAVTLWVAYQRVDATQHIVLLFHPACAVFLFALTTLVPHLENRRISSENPAIAGEFTLTAARDSGFAIA